jgi:thymidylate kinase
MTDRSNLTSLSGSPSRELRARYAGEEVVRGFFRMLETECDRYCILAGYETLPMRLTSDIDFMVSKLDFDRLPHLLKSFADRYGLRLVQAFDHELSARYFILVKLEDKACLYLHPDSASDYRRLGRKWLDAGNVLDHRRLHPRGFWIPAPKDEFDYYLVKKVGKGELNARHGTHLSELYAEDREGCREALGKRWPAASVTKICDVAASSDWSGVSGAIPALAKELLESPQEPDAGSRLMEVARKSRRVLAPSGCWITLLGPDGSGKSSLIEALTDVTQPAFRNVHSYHLRPGLLLGGKNSARKPVTDPHALPARSVFASLAKLAVFWCDYVGGYWLRVRPRMVHSTLVIFDRYFHDLLVDSKRYRFNAPRWLTRLAGRFLPLPDLVFILDAPPEVLQARKQEVSLAECTRQCEAYKGLAEDLQSRTRTVVIDTSLPLDECVRTMAGEIFDFLEARTARRYGIGS